MALSGPWAWWVLLPHVDPRQRELTGAHRGVFLRVPSPPVHVDSGEGGCLGDSDLLLGPGLPGSVTGGSPARGKLSKGQARCRRGWGRGGWALPRGLLRGPRAPRFPARRLFQAPVSTAPCSQLQLPAAPLHTHAHAHARSHAHARWHFSFCEDQIGLLVADSKQLFICCFHVFNCCDEVCFLLL